MKKETISVTVNLPKELIQRVMEYADGLNINRTSAICVLLSQALEYKDAMGFVGTIPGIFEKIEALQKGRTEPLLLT